MFINNRRYKSQMNQREEELIEDGEEELSPFCL